MGLVYHYDCVLNVKSIVLEQIIRQEIIVRQHDQLTLLLHLPGVVVRTESFPDAQFPELLDVKSIDLTFFLVSIVSTHAF